MNTEIDSRFTVQTMYTLLEDVSIVKNHGMEHCSAYRKRRGTEADFKFCPPYYRVKGTRKPI
jgi:hypothetical protein